jgi:hypothetical protein
MLICRGASLQPCLDTTDQRRELQIFLERGSQEISNAMVRPSPQLDPVSSMIRDSLRRWLPLRQKHGTIIADLV